MEIPPGAKAHVRNPGAQRHVRKKMKRCGIILAILAGITAAPTSGQQADVGKVVRSDPALDKLISPGTKIEKIHGGFRFTEGPVWVRPGSYLLFSDLPANAIMRWRPDGTVSVFRGMVFAGTYPDGVQIGSNGLTLDKQGRLIAAEHGNRRVSRLDNDGKITVLADRYEGKRLNSPNDLVCKSNGDVYFTDPPGLYRTYPDVPGAPKRELDFAGVYRVTKPEKVELATKDVPYPNGLAFSPDEKKLYIASSRPEKFWMVYDVEFTTGKIRWARELRTAHPPLLRHVKNSYASETAVTDGVLASV